MKIRPIVNSNPLLAIMRNVPDEILLDYVGAIIDGGVNFFEVALNSNNALEQIALLKKHFGSKAKIGAGTAITVERAQAALSAGAEFLLSPSTNEDVLAFAEREEIPMLPGVLTPTDVTLCMRHGFYTLKLFPASAMPIDYIKSLKGPLDETEYVAIGGINADNIPDYIKAGAIGVGLGSNIIPKAMIAARDWTAASEYVNSLVDKVNALKRK
jgi:2-dehydro-3-deoxyphosphogluconate aldolase/(4S)-4-hydroxy-2-oxoglutarate aldolase